MRNGKPRASFSVATVPRVQALMLARTLARPKDSPKTVFSRSLAGEEANLVLSFASRVWSCHQFRQPAAR